MNYRYSRPDEETGVSKMQMDGQLYYSFTYGPVHVIVLNSEEPFEKGSNQYRYNSSSFYYEWTLLPLTDERISAGLRMSCLL